MENKEITNKTCDGVSNTAHFKLCKMTALFPNVLLREDGVHRQALIQIW